MHDKILVSKKTLITLIASQFKLEALEADGVDNWSFYGYGFQDWLQQAGYDSEDFEGAANEYLEQFVDTSNTSRENILRGEF